MREIITDQYLSDEQIQKILTNFCGTPPRKELVEYHIWVNQSKLNFYSNHRDNGLWNEQEHADLLDSYKRLVKAGIEVLKTLIPDGQLELNL